MWLVIIRPELCAHPSHLQKPPAFQDCKMHVGCFDHLKINYTKQTNDSTTLLENNSVSFLPANNWVLNLIDV